MSESERQKPDDYALTKFAYHPDRESPPGSFAPSDSPVSSPVLPKRPSIPTKPPRKLSNSSSNLANGVAGVTVSPKLSTSTPTGAPPPVPARPERSVGSQSPVTNLGPEPPVKPPVPPKPHISQPPSKLAPPPPQQQPQQSTAPGPKVRTRHKNESDKEDVIARLRLLCNPQNPKDLYTDFKKIGQGASGGVFIAKYLDLGLPVAIKQMDLDRQPKKELIINEIVVMNSAKHKNIVNYIDSFLVGNVLWVVMEFMEGGSLTETATINFMTDEHISIVCREVLIILM